MDTSVVEEVSSATKKQKHGLACVPCAAAKTKCLRSDKDSSCERCLQLKKHCTSQTPLPRKRKAGPPTTTRVAQLEQKLNGLVTLLTSQQVPTTEEEDSVVEHTTFQSAQVSTNLPTPDGSASARIKDYLSPSSDGRRHPSRSATESAGVETTWLSRAAPHPTLEVEDGRVILDLFYTRMLPYFPFAVLQPDHTVESLQKTQPFLWKVIRCVASSRDRQRQENLGAEIMQEICTRMLMSTEKSLELLQGILVFSAWNHYQFTSNGQLSTLVYLAKSLTTNLGLERAPGAIDRRALWLSGNPIRCNTASSSDRRIHNLAEQRAFLTCYYLVMSRVKLGWSNAEMFHYTPYIEKCCQTLESTQECQNDLLLVYLVRVQNIVSEINQTFPYDEIETFKALGTPVALCIKALRMKLSGLRSSVPGELEHNPIFLMAYYSAEMSIYEVALYDTPEAGTRSSVFNLQLDKLGLLHGCLLSVTAYFDIYTKLPREDATNFPFTVWMQSGLAILTAIELSFLQLENWDTAEVRETINITKILDHEIETLEEIAAKRQQYPSDDIKKDIFWRFAERMRKTRSLYVSKMNVENQNVAGKENVNGNEIDMTETLDGILAGDLLSGWDESFWQTFVSDQWDGMGILGNV